MLHQHQPAVPRLGLAAFTTGCEALHGVGWIGRATVFPQAVGLGATWDRDLLRRVCQAVSNEVRAFRQDTENAMQENAVAEKAVGRSRSRQPVVQVSKVTTMPRKPARSARGTRLAARSRCPPSHDPRQDAGAGRR